MGLSWCREGGSNPHEGGTSADFESAASASSAIPALGSKAVITGITARSLLSIAQQHFRCQSRTRPSVHHMTMPVVMLIEIAPQRRRGSVYRPVSA